MDNKKQWDILLLSGDFNHIDILSSYISDESLGSYLNDDRVIYYFTPGKKPLIETILNKYINTYDISFSWDVQEDKDWHLTWKDNFKPIEINKDLIIIPDWDNEIYNHKDIIKIKPGMAFGTGHHETTFLMIQHLIKNIEGKKSVLDLGSGSGILSIISHKYGVDKIVAIEIDDDCRDNFFENLQLNHINKDEIDFRISDVLSFRNLEYDIILANINKNIIKELIPNFQNTKAKILLSGILEEDQIEIESLIKLHGMNLIYKDQYNEWVLMVIEND